MKRMLFGLLLCALLIPSAMANGGQDAAKAKDGKVHIAYSFWGTPDEAKVVNEQAAAFNASQGKIVVEVMPIPHDSYIT